MGAQQSTGQEPSSGLVPAKTCYYELLAVDRQATDEEIKKAYRRKALELHPDRNYNNVEEATERFAQVQTAYEVLSDPQERAWYDSHRESILRGDDGVEHDGEPTTFRNIRLTSTEEIHQLMRRFNASVPFNDEPNGFFGITHETFEHLALEEEAACDLDGMDCPVYPTFGCSDDDYENIVKPFYSIWSGFSTRKSFAWKDKYRLSDAPDRQVRRLMEKENKKLRDDAAREFNDAVRFLVVFVRKRDPRYIPNTQTDSERQRILRNAAAAQAARARAANQEKLASHHVADWAQSRDDSGTEEHDSDTEEETESDEVEILECVVCEKSFKSHNQLEAHERSKKHIKAVQKLRWRMKREGAELEIDTRPSSKPSLSTTSEGNKAKDAHQPLESDGESSELGEIQRHCETEDADIRSHEPLSSLNATSMEQAPRMASPDIGELSDEDYAPRSIVEDRLAPSNSHPAPPGSDDPEAELSIAAAQTTLEDKPPLKKIGKAKAKRERKAAQRNPGHPELHRCTVCSLDFTSRSKLFQHIRDEDHAAPTGLKTMPSQKGKSKKQAR